jgi:hypothetical protein
MRGRAPALVLLAGLCAPAAIAQVAVGDAPARDASRILRQMRAACGGARWERVAGWHERGRVEFGGMTGRHEAWSDMRTLKSASAARFDNGMSRRAGYNGRVFWLVPPGGAVQISTDPAALRRQRRDTYLSSYGWFLPNRFPARFMVRGEERRDGRVYDVITVTPAGADSADLWVDRHTRRIGRIVAGREFVDLSDYRNFSGLCSPTRGRQGDGDSTRIIVLHIEAVTLAALPPATFDPPAAPAPTPD